MRRTASRSGAVEFGPCAMPTMPHISVTSLDPEYLVHAAPAEVAQQPLQPAFHAAQVGVVPEARLERQAGDPRLVRVDFPGMTLEDARLLVMRVHTPESRAKNPVRKQPEVAASPAGQALPEKLHGRDRHFKQWTRTGPVRKPRRVWNPVKIVVNREDTRVVAEPEFLEHVQRP